MMCISWISALALYAVGSITRDALKRCEKKFNYSTLSKTKGFYVLDNAQSFRYFMKGYRDHIEAQSGDQMHCR
jgi:hypothetical protein